MLIRCPKCGFQQPTDKYCAQCGVDIENFKPQSSSPAKKFFTNPLVHLSALVVVASALGISLYQDQKNKTAAQPLPTARITQVSSANFQNNPESTGEAAISGDSTTAPTPVAFDEYSEDSASEAASLVSPSAAPSVVDAQETAPTPTPTATAAAKNPGVPHVTVYYAEVTRPELQALFEQSQTTGQFMSFGDYTAGILPGLEKRITPSNLNIKILHKEDRQVEAKTPLRLSYGRPNAGLDVFIEPTELDAQAFRGNMEVRRNWVELNAAQAPEPSRKSFPANIELTSSAGFFISGVLPRKTPVDNDNEITNLNIFRVLRSPAFQRGDSEFVIFIEFDRNN